ncbi:MAG: FmdE family protein [Chloroflexi bacterium]|nr:FmdE family protein [Chloroflexota bacterium]
MDRNDELYKVGLALHGHKCPAMPLGLRAGLAAMEALGVQHAPDGQLTAFVEIDKNHCSTCFADGVQVATGCTFGKGNIRSLGYGKFGLTLIDNKTGRRVRVVATPEAMRRSQQSEFIEHRKKGVPASQVDAKLVEPLIDKVLSERTDVLFKVEPIQQVPVPPMAPHAFDTILCAECGEVTVERYARVKHGKIVCTPCAEKV